MNTYEPSLGRGRPDRGTLLDGVELVILDFDGVIADSEVISLATLQETLSAFGLELSFDDVRQAFLGRSLASIETYVDEHGPHKTGRDFATSWQTKLFDRFRAELTPMPHLATLLKHLSEKGISNCIASSGTFERLGVALSALGLSEQFASIFSSEQVDRGKPDPDLFLFAAQRLGVRPEACLVIEDSPFGVRAAKTANMQCVGFVAGSHLQGIADEHGELLRKNGADVIVASFEAFFVKHAS